MKEDYITMLNCVVNRELVEYLNSITEEKNNLSLLNGFSSKSITNDCMNDLEKAGLIDSKGNILESVQKAMDVLSNPYATVKLVFTGGAGKYEHNISYDQFFEDQISFTETPNNISIEDETNPQSIINVVEDFVGKSNLKSINFSQKFSVAESMVIAAMLDMERKSYLKAFADEIPYNHNFYNTNMIWRIINSTSSSIQWFVYIMEVVVGTHEPLTKNQVQDALDQLLAKGLITNQGGVYQLSSELLLLSNRMIIIDNILAVQAAKKEENVGTLSTGFTCIQSGVHDLLFLDYNDEEITFETISSVRLIEYLGRFFDCKAYFSQM